MKLRIRLKHATATSITQIRVNKNDQPIVLSSDVNYATHWTINCQDINEIIYINNSVDTKSRIERNNQSLAAISLQLRKTSMTLIRNELDLTREKERHS